jgi:hypothetical protein
MFVIVGGNGMEHVGCGAVGQLVKSRFMAAGMARDGTSPAYLLWADIGNINSARAAILDYLALGGPFAAVMNLLVRL